MSLLFTLLHAHRRDPRNISIIVHTHRPADAASSSLRPSFLPLSTPLSLSLSLFLVLVRSIREDRARPSRAFFPAAFSSARLHARCYPPQHLCVRHSLLLLSSRSRYVPSSPAPPISHRLFSFFLSQPRARRLSLSLGLSNLVENNQRAERTFSLFFARSYCSYSSRPIPEERRKERERGTEREKKKKYFPLCLSLSR